MLALAAFVGVPLGQRLLAQCDSRAVSDPVDGGTGPELLTGYGQLSLGSAAFMSVGAFASYNLLVRVPALPLPAALLLGGVASAAGRCAVRVAEPAHQGFLSDRVDAGRAVFRGLAVYPRELVLHDNMSGVLSAPQLAIGRWPSTIRHRAICWCLAWHRAVRTGGEPRAQRTGAALDGGARHGYGGARDRHPDRAYQAARLCAQFFRAGHRRRCGPLRISARSNRTFSLNLSFQILFIIIIGGMGSIGGNFLGAAFVVLLPILLSNAGSELARIESAATSCRTCRRSCSAAS
jgi:branched-chain amino acid transport system permease protein